MNKKNITMFIIIGLLLLGIGFTMGYYLKKDAITSEECPIDNEKNESESVIIHEKKYDLAKVFNCTNKNTNDYCDLDIKGFKVGYDFDEYNKDYILYYNDLEVYRWKYYSYKEDLTSDTSISLVDNYVVVSQKNSFLDGYFDVGILSKDGKVLYSNNYDFDNNEMNLFSYNIEDDVVTLSYIDYRILSNGVYECSESDKMFINEGNGSYVVERNIKLSLKNNVVLDNQAINFSSYCNS